MQKIAEFKERYPSGTNAQLKTFMGASSLATARYWKHEYEMAQKVAVGQ